MADAEDRQLEPAGDPDGDWTRLVVEAVRDYAIFMIDQDGTIATWNAGVEHILGYAADEFVGRPLTICYTAEDVAANKPGRELELAAQDGRYQEQGWRVRKNDELFWADEVLIALYDDAGTLNGFAKVVRDLTERRESDKWLRSAVEHALDGVVIIDESGLVQTFNRQAEQIFGYAATEVIGQNVTMLMPRIYRAEFDGHPGGGLQGTLSKLIGTGPREVEGLRKDGSAIPLELAVGQFALDGRRHFIGSVRDISPLRQRLRYQEAVSQLGQAALSAEELQPLIDLITRTVAHILAADFSKLLEMLPDGRALVLRSGTGWKEGAVGHALVEVGQGSQAGYTLMCAEPVIVSDVRAETRFSTAKLLRDHGVVSGVSVVVHGRDGPFGVLGIHAKRQREFGVSEVAFLQSVANVISAFVLRKSAETSLRQAHAELRQVVDSNMIGIAFWTPEGLLTHANDYCLRLLGYSREELEAGKVGWAERTPPEFRERDEAALKEVAETGVFSPFEKEFLRKDGSRVPVLIAGGLRPGTDDHGIAFILDLTYRRQLEEQVRQSQKMEAIGQLAAGVAHDFNNLLTVISGYSALLLASVGDGGPDREMVEEISKAAERAGLLTSQLLAFSRQQVLEPQVVDLKMALSGIEKMLGRLIGEHVILTVRVDPLVGAVRIDPGQLQQILINLAVNARDAMPEGGRLDIEARRVTLDEAYVRSRLRIAVPPGEYVALLATDTGTGMNEATLSRLFEPFFTTKPPGKGTGLGLATVYGGVKQAGGSVEVSSAEGRGATFGVYLPAVAAAAPAAGTRAASSATTGRGETILVAEDEPAVRALTCRILEKQGYNVLVAEHGAEALEKADRHSGRIDLLVSDMVMPHMGGRELMKRLTRSIPGLKVLFLSGYTDDFLLHGGGLEAGVHFLQKPFSPGHLAAKVRDVLDERGGEGKMRGA